MNNFTAKEKRLLVVLASVVVVSYGAMVVLKKLGQEYVREVTVEHTSHQSGVAQYSDRLAKIKDEERLQNQYIEAYRRYDLQGLIKAGDEVAGAEVAKEDEELRLKRLSRLQEVQQHRSLESVGYTLNQPEIISSEYSEFTKDSSVAVRVNSMTVQLPLIHELDLLMLLGDYYDAETNRFFPVKCSLKSLLPEGQQLARGDFKLEPHAEGSCDLIWVTVFDPEKGKERSDKGPAA